ncbi:MAG: GNAT family N-acetyltransferase [Acidimicrobiia bacterium]|nr:GNAT family N-acetyltransferase [Acidimicrobiia bacterium]
MTTSRPLLTGKRIRLTAIEPPDHAAIAAWSHDPDYLRNMRTGPAAPESVAQIAKWINQDADDPNRFSFAVRLHDSPDMIGLAGLKDIEWANRSAWLLVGIGPADQRGRGLGSEAVGLLIQFAFDELNLHRLALTVVGYNQRAINTYVGHGFVEEGSIREAVERDGVRHPLLIFGLLAAERRR